MGEQLLAGAFFLLKLCGLREDKEEEYRFLHSSVIAVELQAWA